MKYLISILIAAFSLQSKAQLLTNFSDWTDSVTLNHWQNKNFVRADTIHYKGYKLYSLNNPYFAVLHSHDSTQGILSRNIPVDFRPLQVIIIAASRSNVANHFRLRMTMTKGIDTIAQTIVYNTPSAPGEPFVDEVNKTITWQQYLINIDSAQYWSGYTPDTVKLKIDSRTYSGSMNDTTDIWIDEIIFLDHHTSIAKQDAPKDLKVYPNPAAEATTLEFSLQKGAETRLMLFDLFGKKHFEESYQLGSGINQVRIPLSNLPSGIYYCELQTLNGKAVIKVQVLQR